MTRQAVRTWVAQRNREAQTELAADPYAHVWTRTDSHAQSVCSRMAKHREQDLRRRNPNATAEEIKAARSHGAGDALAKFRAELADHQAKRRREREESDRAEQRYRRRRLKEDAELDRQRLEQSVTERLRKFSAGVSISAAADATANVSDMPTSRGKQGSSRPRTADTFHSRMRHAINEIEGRVGDGDEEGARKLMRASERELDARCRRLLNPPKAA